MTSEDLAVKIQLLHRVAEQSKSAEIVVSSQGALLDRSILEGGSLSSSLESEAKARAFEDFLTQSKKLTSKIARFYLELKQEQEELADENRGLEAVIKVAPVHQQREAEVEKLKKKIIIINKDVAHLTDKKGQPSLCQAPR